MGTTVLSGW